MSNRLIGARLGIAFAILVCILGGVGWLAVHRMGHLNALAQEEEQAELSYEALDYSDFNGCITTQIFLMRDRELIDGLLTRKAENTQRVTALIQKLKSLSESTQQSQLLDAVEESRRPYLESYRSNLDLFLAGGSHELTREKMVRTRLLLLTKYRSAGMTSCNSKEPRWTNTSMSTIASMRLPDAKACAALDSLKANGPYAVVVSDMRMPGMDGVTLLSRVRDLAPNTVRVIFTGHADLQSAMNAVNEGHIFRFLTKPCESDVRKKTLTTCLVQYRLITAEKELLENTLMGAIKVLTDGSAWLTLQHSAGLCESGVMSSTSLHKCISMHPGSMKSRQCSRSWVVSLWRRRSSRRLIAVRN